MSRANAEQVGKFIMQLRKEQGLTQKQLAEKVFVSDKAVSKWERGLSLPDIELLMPLAETLQVTVTELLQGKRLAQEETFTIGEVENLVSGSLELSVEELLRSRKRKQKRMLWYALEIFIAALEVMGLYFWGSRFGISKDDLAIDVWLVELLPLIFGLWFFFFIKEKLPAIYDKEKISFYCDGVFRMNMTGVHFNNRNWPHILRAGRLWCAIVPVAYPVCYLLLRMLFGADVWQRCRLFVTLFVVLGGLFLPMLIVGRKYE